MSDPNYTAVLLVLDNSGSMGGAPQGAMRTALHEVMEQQGRKLAGYLTFDVAYYDTSLFYVETMADPFTLYLDYGRGGGGTMTCRSTLRAIEQFEANINKLPEAKRPGHVVVIVCTDGDTGDHQFAGAVKNKINALRKKKWDFAYLFAGQSLRGNEVLDIPSSNAIAHGFNKEGIAKMVTKLNSFITTARGGGSAKFN